MSKKVTLVFEDFQSLTTNEIETNLRSAYGNNAEVTVSPSSNSAESYISFGISQLLTEEQALIFYDQPEMYQQKLKTLRHEVVKKLLFVLNDVIMENEEKFSS